MDSEGKEIDDIVYISRKRREMHSKTSKMCQKWQKFQQNSISFHNVLSDSALDAIFPISIKRESFSSKTIHCATKMSQKLAFLPTVLKLRSAVASPSASLCFERLRDFQNKRCEKKRM